jgi:TP901 family phage tail tape measure protein
MSDKEFTVAAKIIANSSSFKAGMRESQSTMKTATRNMKNDIDSLKRAWTSMAGKLATVGVGVGIYELAKGSALLDRALNRVGIQAGKGKKEIKEVREELERLGIKTGAKVDELANGFKRLIELTGSWDAAGQSIGAINTAIKTTGASTDLLAQSLAVAQTSFGVDLTKKGSAMDVLDKLAGIGMGAGGLENVAGIFNQIAPIAQLSGLDFNGALRLISSVSQVTKNPEQMGAYSESILRMFTNLKSITNKKSGFGNILFGPGGERRDPITVLQEIKRLYDTLSERKKVSLLTGLTGGMDARSLKSVEMYLNSPALKNVTPLKSGDLTAKLPQVMDNAADQAERLKNLLEEAAEGFIKPMNKGLADMIQWMLDKNLSGADIVGLGAAGALTTWLGGRKLGGGIEKLLSSKTGLVTGLIEGTAMKQLGIIPVFVTNFSEMSSQTGLSGGKFQNYLPGLPEKIKVPGALRAAMKVIPKFAGPIAGGIIAGYTTAKTVEATKNWLYNPTARIEPGLSRPGENVGGSMSPSNVLHKTDITVIIDGEKKKPSKTIVNDNRGSFLK